MPSFNTITLHVEEGEQRQGRQAAYYHPYCSILSVDYTARKYGVARGMTGEEASVKCPQLHLFRVPEKRGKADLTKYRDVGAKVIQILTQFSENIERASVDEAFLELTVSPSVGPSPESLSGTKIAGWNREHGSYNYDRDLVTMCIIMAILYNADNEGGREFIEWLEKDRRGEEVMLARAAVVVQQIRGAVLQATGCTCSAGIAHNKVTLVMKNNIIMLVVHSADVGKISCWNE